MYKKKPYFRHFYLFNKTIFYHDTNFFNRIIFYIL
jgi:hypothetical protein